MRRRESCVDLCGLEGEERDVDSESFPVERAPSDDDLLPIEIEGPEPEPSSRIREPIPEGHSEDPRHVMDVVWVEIGPEIPDDLPMDGDVRKDGAGPARHRFDRGKYESLFEGGGAIDGGKVVEFDESFGGDVPEGFEVQERVGSGGLPEPGRDLMGPRADDPEMDGSLRLGDDAEGVDDPAVVLVGIEPAHEEDTPFLLADVREDAEDVRRDAPRDDRAFPIAIREDVATDGLRVGDEGPRPDEPGDEGAVVGRLEEPFLVFPKTLERNEVPYLRHVHRVRDVRDEPEVGGVEDLSAGLLDRGEMVEGERQESEPRLPSDGRLPTPYRVEVEPRPEEVRERSGLEADAGGLRLPGDDVADGLHASPRRRIRLRNSSECRDIGRPQSGQRGPCSSRMPMNFVRL